MRAIDADALIGELHTQFFYDGRDRTRVYAKIQDQPTVEPERETGEWEEIAVIADAYDISGVKTWASKMMCDQCGFTTIAIEGGFSQYNYCPYCGADMRGETE